MNRYLEKIAERKNSPLGETVAAGAGVLTMGGAPSRLLGYHTIHHGTSAENAKLIREKGFDPSKGGSRNALLRADYTENSKGKVHFTKTKPMAAAYAGDLGGKIKQHGNPGSAFAASFKDYFKGKGKVVTSRVPHSLWNKMEVDRDSSRGAPRGPEFDEKLKERASTYSRKIDPKFVEGSKTYKGRSMYATTNNLKRYLSTASGKSRALSGLGRLGAGSAIVAGAAYHNAKNNGILAKLRNSKSQSSSQ